MFGKQKQNEEKIFLTELHTLIFWHGGGSSCQDGSYLSVLSRVEKPKGVTGASQT